MQYINSDPKKRRPYGISQIGGGSVYVPTPVVPNILLLMSGDNMLQINNVDKLEKVNG